MQLQSSSTLRTLHKFTDLVLLALSCSFAYWLRYNTPLLPPDYLLPTFVFIVITSLTLQTTAHYSSRYANSSILTIQPTFLGVGIGALLTAMLFFMTQTGANYSRIWFGLTVALSALLTLGFRVGAKNMLRATSKPINFLLLGNNASAHKIAQRFQDREGQFNCLQHVTELPLREGKNNLDLTLAKEIVENARIQGTTSIDQVWVTQDIFARIDPVKIELVFGDTAAGLVFIPELPELPSTTPPNIAFLQGVPTIGAGLEDHKRLDNLAKWLQDKILGTVAIILLAPLFLMIALLIKLDSPGPVLFRQHRYGLGGKEFEIFKFRTMTMTASAGEFKQATKHDIRVTRVGTFLRKTSLDELPQLLNVLQGSMSLVGPRPHPVALNEEYRDIISGYMSRHRVKPGLTGLAQINGYRGETADEGAMKGRIALDLEYIKSWTTLKDMQIMLQTIARIFRDPNAY